MRRLDLRQGARRLRNLVATSLLFSLATWLAAPTATQNCVADGETRTLHLYHTHTLETIDATFRIDGHYDPAVLQQLNHFLRDWRNNDEINMDPRLFDAIWEAYRTAGATDRIQIYSAYRSPETNAMLRRRSKAVAEHSQHMLGKAMDTTMPGFPMHRIREVAMQLQHGGVGWYPSANFVHIDVGGVRSWPRMPYDQLAALFPDGKTVHIASNGQTLPGYDQARLELAQRGQTDLPPAQQDSGGFFAWLFGGGSSGAGAAREDEEDRRTAVASAAPAPAAQPQVQAQPAQAEAPQPQPQPATQEASASPAIAYAPQAQDPRAPAEVQAAASAAPGQPEPQQAAAVETTAPEADAAPMPLPPRRPAEFVVAADVPLPPARPVSIATNDAPDPVPPRRPDTLASLEAQDGAPALRAGALPDLITGAVSQKPRTALAFAGEPVVAPGGDLRPIEGALRPVGLRASAHRRQVLATPTGSRRLAATQVASTDVPRSRSESVPMTVGDLDAPSAVVGPHVTGLRRAAHQLAAADAL